MIIRNFFGHLKTILHHKRLVFVNCCRSGIIWQGIVHDLSKFSLSEFIPGVKYFQGTRSPNEKERRLYGCSKAWMHHKGRNKHHFEYWNDYNLVIKNVAPVKMPAKYLAEMFCDRIAASKTYLKNDYTDSKPLEYYLNSTARRCSLMHEETAAMLCELLECLSSCGEKAAFAKVREMVKKGNY